MSLIDEVKQFVEANPVIVLVLVALLVFMFFGCQNVLRVYFDTDSSEPFAAPKGKNKKEVRFFFSEQCGYCHKFFPVWEKVVAGMQSKCSFTKANAAQQAVAQEMAKYDISGFPTVVFLKDGKIAGKQEGYRDFDEFAASVREFVNNM